MRNICELSLTAVASLLQAKKIGVEETVQACLERIEKTEPAIQALLTINGENALAQARAMDNDGPVASRPLWGTPIIIKDAISTKGLRTTAASRILENFVPIYDAFVIQKLKEAGAIILAKANMDEFAMGSSTENSAYQKTRNPWDLKKVPGGSSGGSAACVAACQAFGSLGSDTGGSIRQPAAFCGCVGLKPTYGRVSRRGLFAFASSMDQIGPICRTVEDCARLLQVISGHDCRDNTSDPCAVPDYLSGLGSQAADHPLNGVAIGFPEAFFGEGLSDEVRKACLGAIEKARELGAKVVPITLPDPSIASATYYILAMAEASSNLARYDGVRYGQRAPGVSTLDDLYLKSRSLGFGMEVKRRIMLGSYVLSSGYYDAYFKKGAQTRRIIFDQYRAALEQCDIICMPVAPVTAWELGSHETDPLAAYLMDAYTLPLNLAGLPGLSLPVGLGFETGMPVGLQLVGKPFGEAELLRAAALWKTPLAELAFPAPVSQRNLTENIRKLIMIVEKEERQTGPERIYIAAATLKELRGHKNVEVQLFRLNGTAEEMADLKDQGLVGEPPAEMPKELLAGATEENALACLLETFTASEIEQMEAYLKERYADQIERLVICPMSLPVPLGVGPLAKIPESESSGFINFDLAPDYPLPFAFRGFYEVM